MRPGGSAESHPVYSHHRRTRLVLLESECPERRRLSEQVPKRRETMYVARTYANFLGRYKVCEQNYPAQAVDVSAGSIGAEFAPGNIRKDEFELDQLFIATFIPIDSALDIRNGISMFDRTFHQSQALTHSAINPEMTDFVLEELLGPERRFNPKLMADGMDATLYGWVVTGTFSGAFSVETPDRSNGLMVISSEQVTPGEVVTVRGVMTTLNAERRFIASTVLHDGTRPHLEPVAMPNRQLGGGGVGSATPGVTGGAGLNNTGLLVSTWGVVTAVGADHLYIDDGSDLADGTGSSGVRVVCDPTGYGVGDRLVVTGISSCFETLAGDIARRVLTRSASDIVKHQNNP